MFRIRKLFEFEANHRLTKVPAGHKCGFEHGHSYVVELFLESEILDYQGFIVDFGELNRFKEKYIDFPEGLDHSNLNEKLDFETTAENIAQYLYFKAKDMFPQVVKVRVWETRKGYAEYYQTITSELDLMLNEIEKPYWQQLAETS